MLADFIGTHLEIFKGLNHLGNRQKQVVEILNGNQFSQTMKVELSSALLDLNESERAVVAQKIENAKKFNP